MLFLLLLLLSLLLQRLLLNLLLYWCILCFREASALCPELPWEVRTVLASAFVKFFAFLSLSFIPFVWYVLTRLLNVIYRTGLFLCSTLILQMQRYFCFCCSLWLIIPGLLWLYACMHTLCIYTHPCKLAVLLFMPWAPAWLPEQPILM